LVSDCTGGKIITKGQSSVDEYPEGVAASSAGPAGELYYIAKPKTIKKRHTI